MGLACQSFELINKSLRCFFWLLLDFVRQLEPSVRVQYNQPIEEADPTRVYVSGIQRYYGANSPYLVTCFHCGFTI